MNNLVVSLLLFLLGILTLISFAFWNTRRIERLREERNTYTHLRELSQGIEECKTMAPYLLSELAMFYKQNSGVEESSLSFVLQDELTRILRALDGLMKSQAFFVEVYNAQTRATGYRFCSADSLPEGISETLPETIAPVQLSIKINRVVQ